MLPRWKTRHLNKVPFISFQRLREEQATRLVFERSVREEVEKRWQSLKAYVDEEAHSIRQSEKVNSQAAFFLLSFSNSHFKRQVQHTGHRSLFYQYRKYP